MAREIQETEYRLIDKVTEGFRGIAATLKGLSGSFTEVNQAAELASKGINLVTDAATKIVDGVKGAADFQTALAELQGVTTGTAEQMAQLKNAAVDASEATKFTAIEAAQGLTELARAGLSATAAIEVLNPALALAQGQQLSVAESASLVTTTLTQFGLAAEEAGRVTDVYASAADKSQLSVQELALAMGYAGPLARQLGLSLEETTGIIGKLADEGFRGEKGGTALRSTFTALIDPASQFRAELEKLGIQSTDFTEVMEQLKGKGDDARDALLALDASASPAITSLASKGAAGIRDLTAALNDSQGAAQRTADILGETFEVQFAKLTNALTNTKNALLVPILEPLSNELEVFKERISEFVQSEQFERISLQITAFATKAIKAIGDTIESFDFEKGAASVEEFVTAAVNNFNTIIGVANFVGKSIATVYDVVKGGAAGLVESFTGVLSNVFAALGVFSDGAAELSIVFGDMSREARKLGDEALQDLEKRFGTAADESVKLKDGLDAAAVAARQLKGDFSDLKDALPKPDILSIANNFGLLADKLGKDVPKAADETKKSIGQLNAQFDDAVDYLRATQTAYEQAFDAGVEGANEAFKAVQEAGSEVARLRKELDTTKVSADELKSAFSDIGVKSQKDLIAEAEKARRAFELITQAVKDGGAAQADVARAFEAYAARLRETADGADEATRRQIAQQIELAGVTAGVSRELINAATAGLGIGDALEKSGDKANRALAGVQKSAEQTAEKLQEAEVSAKSYAAANNSMAAAVDGATAAQDGLTIAATGYIATIKDGIFVMEDSLDINIQMANAARDEFEARNPLARQKRLEAEAEAALTEKRKESAAIIARQIEQLEAQDPQLRREKETRAELAKTLDTEAEGFDRLLALRIKYDQQRETGLGLAQQEIEQSQQLAAANNQQQPGSQNAQGGGDTFNPTFNFNGIPATREAWRDFVANIIVPELERLRRLSA